MRHRLGSFVLSAAAGAGLWVLGAGRLAAQRPVELLRTADGITLDFRPNGVWRAKARAVAARRAQLQAQGQFGELNVLGATGSALSVSGNLGVPSILLAFKGTDTTLLPKAVQYDSIFYTTVPLSGRPYTVRTFYDEMSNNALHVVGQTYGWVRVDSTLGYYTGGCAPGGGPIDCFVGRQRTRALLVQSLAEVDGGVDFGQYDNDGPDGIPNSGDDDGVVDVVQFVQPVIGEECSGPGYGAHHFSLSDLGTSGYATNDARTGGAFIVVDEYQIVSGVGGPSCYTPGQIAGIGAFAHETGHGLGLPDLYDTHRNTAGIGEWGLMGTGNSTTPISPAHFDAWCKQQMGWITIAPLTTSGGYAIGPVITADTVFLIRPTGANPRGEYFLIENKQAIGSDAANMNVGGQTGPKLGGLLVWHIDSLQVTKHGLDFDNAVNTLPVYGVRAEEADGFDQLFLGQNFGDAGDAYPGSRGNPVFGPGTDPAAVKNVDGSFVGFALDSIRQVVPDGEMAFRLRFGGVTLVRGSDSTATVQVDGRPFTVFRDLLDDGSSHTIAVADTQLAQSGRRRLRFVSWSDGQPISHPITGVLAGDTIVATLARDFLVGVTVGANGTVSTNPSITFSGTLLAEGTPLHLTATPSPGFAFKGWTGDTIAAADTLTLPLGRPYNLLASFVLSLAITSAPTRPNAVMGAQIDDTLRATGGIGAYSWQIVSGALPPGLTLSAAGRITGIATAFGSFSFTAQATSGGQLQTRAFSILVVAPTLVTADVVARLLRGSGILTVAQLKYLDLIGNNNGIFDVGDFKAWVDASGAP